MPSHPPFFAALVIWGVSAVLALETMPWRKLGAVVLGEAGLSVCFMGVAPSGADTRISMV